MSEVNHNEPQITLRNRLQPLSHGEAASRVTVDTGGNPISWTSENITSIPVPEDTLPKAAPTELSNS
jgi:hypothetical protein